MVEEKADDILSEAHHSHVAFLVVGDPFGYFFPFFPSHFQVFLFAHFIIFVSLFNSL